MKVLICGKGGCGKSTMTALIAKALAQQGTKVLVIDADESNMCLHRLLGASRPDILMDAMGGRSGTREKLNPSLPHRHDEEFFKEIMAIDDLPSQCISHAGKIRMLMIGKIKEYGEGCACMIGGVSKAVLSRLRENENEIVLIDAEAGLEHFGRRVDANCDLVLSIVDPSYESIHMAERTRQLAEGAGVQAYFILNKVDDSIRQTMTEKLDENRVIAVLPHSDTIFLQNLRGDALSVDFPELWTICDFIKKYQKPAALPFKL